MNFIAAPNVHWPEVMFTYESTEKILFSADGFGKFGALDVPSANDWTDEARRYYFGIVGKFGANVQAVLKKAANLEIQKICPLHGPVLDSNLEKYIQYYDTWSKYEAETDGIFIAYTSVYGNTKQAAEKLAEILKEKGCKNVLIKDLARNDIFECVADAFRYKKLVLASTTYNTEVFPKMREFIAHLAERNFQNRTVGFIENCSWAPLAAKTMAKMFEPLKEIKTDKVVISDKIVNSSDVFLYHKTTFRPYYNESFEKIKNNEIYDEIFFNEKGELTEGSRSNVIVNLGGVLYTPPVSCGLLNGTFRQKMLKDGKCEEKILYKKDLLDAQNIYCVNSVRGMREVFL